MSPAPGAARPVRSVALVSSIAYSIANFRGPLIAAMIRAGIRVYALAPDYDDKTRSAVRALGAEPIDISLDRTGMRPARDVLDAWRLARLLRKLAPDLVFNYFAKPVIYGSLAAQFAGIERRYALVAGLGYVFTDNGGERSLKRRALKHAVSRLYWLALKTCDRVFFQNDDDVEQFVGAGLVDRDRVLRLNGSGVDLARLAYTAPPPGPPSFLLMARLLKEKGILEYVEAARTVRRSYPDARFVLLGGVDPNPGGLSKDEVAAWAREGIVEWPGHVDEVQPWIERCSVYVLPSYREGKPRSTQEAMAIGRAIITTDVPGCRDTVEEGVNGFLVPPRESAPLAAAMLSFFEDPGLIERMGSASRRLAEERFDVHQINRTLLAAMGIEFVAPLEPDVPARAAVPC